VVNTECIKNGFQWICQCGDRAYYCGGTQLKVSLEEPNWGVHNPKCSDIMPLEEYKMMLASVILEGKKPRVPVKHKNTINFSSNAVDYQNLYVTLMQLGYKKQEAMSKVDIAVREGFLNDQEIIKYILSLK